MVFGTLTKEVEYAIKILICLALSLGHPTPARAVAQCIQIPLSQAAKILHFLSLRGLTRSRRGSNGGYSLRRSPEEIRVGQVVELFQPPSEEDFEISPDPLRQVWQQTSAGCQPWERLTIAELAWRTAGKWACAACLEEIDSLSAANTDSAAG